MWVGSLSLDLLLGDVHSLKGKRSIVKPIVSELLGHTAVSTFRAMTGFAMGPKMRLDLKECQAEVRDV